VGIRFVGKRALKESGEDGRVVAVLSVELACEATANE